MTHYLEKTLSRARLDTFLKLADRDGEARTFDELYALNMQYSKELYVVLAGLEVTVRNSFHAACREFAQKEDWLSLEILKNKHKKQVDEAIRHLIREKQNAYVFDDIIAQLNYGFWVNLCNQPYDSSLWRGGLYRCFPALGQKPRRKDIRERLERTLQLRNKIAHLEPIIKREELLIQEYRNISELLYSMCPQTQEWFAQSCNFEEIWNNRFEGKKK